MIENLEVKADALRELVDLVVEENERGAWERPVAEKLRDVLMTTDAIDVLKHLLSKEAVNG